MANTPWSKGAEATAKVAESDSTLGRLAVEAAVKILNMSSDPGWVGIICASVLLANCVNKKPTRDQREAFFQMVDSYVDDVMGPAKARGVKGKINGV